MHSLKVQGTGVWLRYGRNKRIEKSVMAS